MPRGHQTEHKGKSIHTTTAILACGQIVRGKKGDVLSRLEMHKQVCVICRETTETDTLNLETDQAHPGASQRFLEDPKSKESIKALIAQGIRALSIKHT